MFNEDFYLLLYHPPKDKTGLERLGDYIFSPCFLCMQMCVMPGAWEMSPSDRVSTSWSPSLPAHQGLTHPPPLLKHPSPIPLRFPRHPEGGGGGGVYYQPFILHSSFALSRNCSHPSRVLIPWSVCLIICKLSDSSVKRGTQHCACFNNNNIRKNNVYKLDPRLRPSDDGQGVRESGSRRLSDSPSFLLNIQKPTQRVGESFFDYEYLLEFEAKIGNGSKGSVRGTNFCKNLRKSASLPCPFNHA